MAKTDIDAIFQEMDQAADRAEETLRGQYAEIYKELRALSPAEIDSITPGTTDQKEYERLMALMQQATKHNLNRAELVSRIKSLGATAIAIASKVPSLARLF